MRLADFFAAAAQDCFPPANGGITVVPPEHGLAAIVAFTAHAVIATTLAKEALLALGADGFGGALHPRVQLAVAGGAKSLGVNDLILIGRGKGGGARLCESGDWNDHPRVNYARRLRRDVRVFGDARGLVTLSRGIGDRLELSIETPGETHGSGAGRALIADALTLLPEGAALFAAVSPGNARSLRAFLACGFRPIGSEVQIVLEGADPDAS